MERLLQPTSLELGQQQPRVRIAVALPPVVRFLLHGGRGAGGLRDCACGCCQRRFKFRQRTSSESFFSQAATLNRTVLSSIVHLARTSSRSLPYAVSRLLGSLLRTAAGQADCPVLGGVSRSIAGSFIIFFRRRAAERLSCRLPANGSPDSCTFDFFLVRTASLRVKFNTRPKVAHANTKKHNRKRIGEGRAGPSSGWMSPLPPPPPPPPLTRPPPPPPPRPATSPGARGPSGTRCGPWGLTPLRTSA